MMQQDSEPIADVPRFAEEIAFYLLGDSGVVFDEAAQKVYQLNTTAAYLWCRIEEGLTPPALAAALAATFGFAPPDAERHLQEALTAWRARGFLAGGPRPERAPRVVFPPAREAAPAIPGDASPCPAQPTDRRYRVLDHVYEVAVAGPEIARWVHPVLQHLACPDLPGEDAVTRVSIGPRHGGFAVARAGGPAYGCSRLDEIAPLVKQLVFSDALARTEQAVAIHAGAVSDGARALILPGPAGSGKTTLTAALAEAGLGYLTDDLVLLSRDGARVRGVPFSLTVKESGVEVLSSRFSGLEALPLHRRADGKRVRYLALPQPGAAAPPQPRIHWIVFPTYDRQGANRLRPIAPSRALVGLAEGCTMMRHVGKAEIAGLVSLLERACCFEIAMSSLDEATRELMRLFEDRGSGES